MNIIAGNFGEGLQNYDLANFGQIANIKLANIQYSILVCYVNGSHAISPKLKLAKCVFFADAPNIMLAKFTCYTVRNVSLTTRFLW